jgi:hypothetical protein
MMMEFSDVLVSRNAKNCGSRAASEFSVPPIPAVGEERGAVCAAPVPPFQQLENLGQNVPPLCHLSSNASGVDDQSRFQSWERLS